MPLKEQTDRKGHRGPRIVSLALLASGAAATLAAMIWHDASRLKPQGTPRAVELAQGALSGLGYDWARVSMRGTTVHLMGLAPDDSARVMAYAATRQALRPLMGRDATVDAIRSHITLDVGAEPVSGHRVEGSPALDVAALSPPPMPLIHAGTEPAAVASQETHEAAAAPQNDSPPAEKASEFVPTAGPAQDGAEPTQPVTPTQTAAMQPTNADHAAASASAPAVRTVTIETSAVDKPEPARVAVTAPAATSPAPAPMHSADSCAEAFSNALTSATINFEKDSATVQRESRPLLDQLATIAKRCRDFRLVVEGHTDLTGSPSHNLLLSRRRAEVVRWALIDRGIDMDHITAEGFGSNRPVERSTSDAANARNRRIAITVREPAPKTTANR